MSLQLSNSSVPAYVEPEFSVPLNVAAVNILLFASLALALIDAYLAVLTKGWLRDFDRDSKPSNVPEERATQREMRFQGLERWRLPEVVALLPILVQASLVLFCLALLIILFNLHLPTAYSTLTILGSAFCFYFCTTVISVLDTHAPFTSPLSRALQALIRQCRVSPIILSCLKWHRGGTIREKMDIEMGVMRQEVKGAGNHLAIFSRLYAATYNAVENLPVFTELFDQWVQTPSLRPLSMSDWLPILPLVQPYLLNTSLDTDFDLRSIARLFLSVPHSEGSDRGRQAVITALGKDVGEPGGSPSVEQLYIHLLRQPGSDWSFAGQVVPKLDAERDTIIELRWILNCISFRYLDQTEESPIEHDQSWVSSMRNVIHFLRSTAVYVIQNRMVNDDHGFFNSLLLITRSIGDGYKVDEIKPSRKSRESQTSSKGIDAELFTSVGDVRVPPKSHWGFIHSLYVESSMSAFGFKRDFTQLVILLMISALSQVEYSVIDPSISYESFIRPNDVPVLMDALWETWQAQCVDNYLLTRIAVWLLKRSSSSFRKPALFEQQRSFQELVDAYDSYTSSSISIMTSNGLRFIEAALLFSLETADTSDGESNWTPQTLKLKNPWLVMHIHNILRQDWWIPGGAMREVAGLQLDSLDRLKRLDGLEWLEWRKGREWRDALDALDRLKALDALDALDMLDALEWREWREWREERERHEWRERREERKERKRHEDREDRERYEDCVHETLERAALRLSRKGRKGNEGREGREDEEYTRKRERIKGASFRLRHRDREDRERYLWRHDYDERGRNDHNECENCKWRTRRKRREEWRERCKWLEQCKWSERNTQESPTALEIIARRRLDLYTASDLCPDPVAFGFFLSQRIRGVFDDSRRLALEFFESTQSAPSLLPPDATELERNQETARKSCSDFFNSKVIEDLTKWRLLAAVVFPEWKTLSTQWKDLLATEVMKVTYEANGEEHRVDWMARVMPLLGGKFNLCEFGLAKDDSTYGPLIPAHLHMVANAVEHLGADRLTDRTICELLKLFEKHSDILCDEEALDRIRAVIGPIFAIECMVFLFSDQT